MHSWLDRIIFINQVAQEVHSVDELITWYTAMPVEQRPSAIRELREMIQHARPQLDDGPEAIRESGLKPTFTPCVLLSKGASREQINKLIALPEAEQTKTLVLLLHLFRIADRRRRSQETDDVERHWWHCDLGDPKILSEIRRRYTAGQL